MTEEYINGQLVQASEEPLYGRPTDLDTQYYPATIIGNYSQHCQKIKITWDSSPKEIIEISRSQIFVSKKRRRNAPNYYNKDDEEVSRIILIIILFDYFIYLYHPI